MSETALRAPVNGGALVGTVWHEGAPGTPILGINGITANHRSFVRLSTLVTAPLVSVDQRGRGRSRALPPPYTLQQHAEDAAFTLDAAGIDKAIVVGHSMGAFVATELAAAYPDRVVGLVLVDGGLPLRPAPKDADPAALLGPAIERLSKTFDSAEDYRTFWRAHPAFGPYWTSELEDYVDYDLQPIDGALRPSALTEAVLTNLVELDGSRGYKNAVEEVERRGIPRILLTSPRGLLDEEPGLFDEAWLQRWADELPGIRVRSVPDSNHYTIMLGDGARAVATAVADLAPVTEGKA